MPITKLDARVLFAKRVRHFRNERGITANVLSAAAAISRNTLHLIENRSANAQLSTIERLSIALAVDPCDFFLPEGSTHHSVRRTQPLQQVVAANIAKLRDQNLISQEALVRAAGLPRSYIWHIENSAPDLSLETVERIAKHLKTEVSALLAESP